MSTIIKYISDMVPYMLTAIPVYLIVRFIIFKIFNKKINWYHEIALFIFILFTVGLASQTIIPKFEFGVSGNFSIIKSGIHRINLVPFKVLFETYNEVFVNGNINYFLINFLGNIFMFIPIGFLIPLSWNISGKKVVLVGFCFSVFIEFCQLFLNRGTDIDDLILNTTGAFLGLLIYKILYKNFQRFLIRFR